MNKMVNELNVGLFIFSNKVEPSTTILTKIENAKLKALPFSPVMQGDAPASKIQGFPGTILVQSIPRRAAKNDPCSESVKIFNGRLYQLLFRKCENLLLTITPALKKLTPLSVVC